MGPVVAGDLEDAWVLFPSFTVLFDKIPDVTSIDDFYSSLEAGVAEMWVGVPGLRSKYFTVSDGILGMDRGHGIYAFTNRADLESYMNSELWKSMNNYPHMTDFEYSLYEILDGSECVTEFR